SGAERVANPVTQAARMRAELRPRLRVRRPERDAVGRAHDLAHPRDEAPGETQQRGRDHERRESAAGRLGDRRVRAGERADLAAEDVALAETSPVERADDS